MFFFEWLITQRDRKDAVGRFARHALNTKFQKSIKSLHAVLRVCGDEHRVGAKRAHKEYRAALRLKKEIAAA